MPGIDQGIVTERKQHVTDRIDQRRVIPTGQIRPANRAGKQRVADEQVGRFPLGRGRLHASYREAHPAGTMARRMVRPRLEVAEAEHITGGIEMIDGRLRFDGKTEQSAVLHGIVVQKLIVAMEADRHLKGAFGRANAGDVVDVRMCQQDVGQRDALACGKFEQAVDLVAGIDEHAFSGSWTCDDESVLEERTHRLTLDYDHDVILAILDDLLFSSKMRSTAKQIGATLTVAKSRDAALADMRANVPSLVIFDLDNPRTDPLGIVVSMKADPALAAIHTLGFVSHVHTELIDAARKAGVDDVMARSMFAERLPQILARGM